MRVLAIDQGTTSTRAFLLDKAGALAPLIGLPHRQSFPAPGWVEHDPEELLGNVRACLNAAADVPDLVAVGIDNQGESCLAWDAETGRAISPVIVWQDDRTAPETDRLRAEGAEPMVRARTGLPLDPYFSASKLGWIVRTLPEARALLAQGRLRLGTTDAFFRDRLTGRFQTDVTTASRTSLFNLAACQWDPELCRLFGVPPEALPEITASSGDLGTVPVGARQVPLTASIVDQQAALYGHGCRQPGDAKITFGTGAFALALTGALPPPGVTAALATIAWQRQGSEPVYALDGGVYSASAAVNWAQGLGLFDDLTAISAFDRPSVAARGLVFVPALAGLACPHWNRAARGTWMGLSLDTTRADMMQALLEGIAFRMAEVLADMARAVALSTPIPIDGGMSMNPWFCQFLADCLNRDILVSEESEVTALGTALLAAEPMGHTLLMPRKGRLVTPRALPAAAHSTFRRARQAAEAAARETPDSP
jgi:glycerol kinase